jgi:hypothetical protein
VNINQMLSNCGLNPYAVSLLVESFKRHPEPKAVAFPFREAVIALCPLDSKSIGELIAELVRCQTLVEKSEAKDLAAKKEA